MLKSKKAFTLEEAVKLGLAAFVFLFIFFAADKLYAAVTAEKDDGSSANFDKLAFKFQELVNNNKKLDYAEINYFLGNERAVVGYNELWDAEKNLEVLHLKIEKPGFCGDRACLCFFKGNSVLSAKPQKPCVKFDKVSYIIKDKDAAIAYSTESTVPSDIFYKPPMPEAFTKDEYKYMLLDGSTLNVKSQVLYIEKYENELGQIVIYVAPVNDATKDRLKQRKEYIDKTTNQ